MINLGLQFSQFVASALFIIVPATVIGFVLIAPTVRHAGRQRLNEVLKGASLAALCGFTSALVWLSWNTSGGLEGLFKYGPPTDFAVWQIVGCGVSVIALSGWLTIKFTQHIEEVALMSLLTGTGFATAFALGASFGVETQESIGVFFSFIGIGTLTFMTNLIVWAIVLVRRRREKQQR